MWNINLSKNTVAGIAVVFLDITSKLFVRNFTNIKIIENRDLPFGINLGSGFFNLAAVMIALAIFVWIFRRNGLGFVLIVSGALSNIIDRIDGSVVDFINIGISTLNLADFAIMGGIAMIAFRAIKIPNS
ncbi:MAG: signal peptidase II [bacterium]|nr:signal peptidase II [bacterium]